MCVSIWYSSDFPNVILRIIDPQKNAKNNRLAAMFVYLYAYWNFFNRNAHWNSCYFLGPKVVRLKLA